jgi:ABC-type multidrug transport system fused ATPase/permease subunit
MIDDSLSDLDEVSLKEVIELTWLSSERPTILTTSTNPRIVSHCDRVVILDSGTIAEVGAPRELAARPDSLFRKLYPTLGQLILALGPSS